MEVASVIPSATLCYTLESSAKDAFLQDLAILDITSPLLHSHEPSFSSAIFTTASQLSTARISFHALRRYNRMATTSALRQTNALGIDLPVFGILINGNQCVIHIDWLENNDGIIVSPFYISLLSFPTNRPSGMLLRILPLRYRQDRFQNLGPRQSYRYPIPSHSPNQLTNVYPNYLCLSHHPTSIFPP